LQKSIFAFGLSAFSCYNNDMSQTVKQYQNHFEWPQIGNENLIEFLDRSLFQHKLAQTYVFSGPEDLGKSTVALAFARNLIISDVAETRDFSSVNSDLHILSREPGKKNISIEAVRDFIKMSPIDC
jgi:DNA polymerase III delta prime subunit